jgi:hypothetical protein
MNMQRGIVSLKLALALMAALLVGSPASSKPVAPDREAIVRGNHPFKDGLNAWYYGLNTALGGHIYFGDVVDSGSAFSDYLGRPVQPHAPGAETSEDYENTHNHYQNLFVQTLNKRPNINAVSIWGDSTSIVDGAKSWGAFLVQDRLAALMRREALFKSMAPECRTDPGRTTS